MIIAKDLVKSISLEYPCGRDINAHMENLNPIQMKILSLLLFKPGARFKELNADFLSTDNFSYHIRCLIGEGLIVKEGYFYSLSHKGKMLAGKIDTDTHTIEKQPKVGVLVIPHMKFGKVEKFLIQQRTKEPYFGYWGFMTGKVRFGETLEMTAERELKEEAGMGAKFRFCYELHEMVYNKNTKEQLEDKFFHIVEAYDLEGDIATKTQEGNNGFYTVEEFKKLSPKYHNEEDIMNWYLKKDFKFKEEKYYIEKF